MCQSWARYWSSQCSRSLLSTSKRMMVLDMVHPQHSAKVARKTDVRRRPGICSSVPRIGDSNPPRQRLNPPPLTGTQPRLNNFYDPNPLSKVARQHIATHFSNNTRKDARLDPDGQHVAAVLAALALLRQGRSILGKHAHNIGSQVTVPRNRAASERALL